MIDPFLIPRPSFEQIIDDISKDKTKIKFPDRTYTQFLDSPLYQMLLADHNSISDHEERIHEHTVKEHEIKTTASQNGVTAQEIRDIMRSVGNLQGPPGPPGNPGTDGRDGRDGRDGKDGKDGESADILMQSGPDIPPMPPGMGVKISSGSQTDRPESISQSTQSSQPPPPPGRGRIRRPGYPASSDDVLMGSSSSKRPGDDPMGFSKIEIHEDKRLKAEIRAEEEFLLQLKREEEKRNVMAKAFEESFRSAMTDQQKKAEERMLNVQRQMAAKENEYIRKQKEHEDLLKQMMIEAQQMQSQKPQIKEIYIGEEATMEPKKKRLSRAETFETKKLTDKRKSDQSDQQPNRRRARRDGPTISNSGPSNDGGGPGGGLQPISGMMGLDLPKSFGGKSQKEVPKEVPKEIAKGQERILASIKATNKMPQSKSKSVKSKVDDLETRIKTRPVNKKP